MTNKEFEALLKRKRGELNDLMHRKGPRVVGVKVVNFLKENYRRGGFSDGGFHKWPVTKRQKDGTPGAMGKYGPLLSKRNRLFSATDYTPGDAVVEIHNNTEYARIHNEGGVTHPTVTPEMRRYFWAMYYKNGGKKSPKADKYKWLALTTKERLTVNIPQRKFVYISPEVKELVKEALKVEVKKIMEL